MPPNTVNNVWGRNVPEGATEWVTTPSGQTCEARRIGMSGMVTSGLLGEADSLTAFIDQKHIRRVRGGKSKPDGDEINVESLARDPESLGKVILLVDRATPKIVVNPPVLLHLEDLPDGTTRMIPLEDRDPNAIYTDQVGFEDKMFLFNWAVGGTRDADRFLVQSGDVVASMEHVEDVPRATKPTPRRSRRK